MLHVDGTFNALERNTKLDWLRADVPDGSCRILTNARCLSEGVDVPALDAVMFLSPRKSIVDVVQSVGRVMRKAPGKKYGYIILPIAIPEGVTPEVALRDNAKYQVVWEVLQALRAHDDRLNAEINKIDLTKRRVGPHQRHWQSAATVNAERTAASRARSALEPLPSSKSGATPSTHASSRRLAHAATGRTGPRASPQIAEAHITRINGAARHEPRSGARGVRQVPRRLAGKSQRGHHRGRTRVEMLAQHLITRPVFDALFGGYDFAAHNPVAQAMEQMLATLDDQNLDYRERRSGEVLRLGPHARAGHRHRRGSAADHRRAVRHVLLDRVQAHRR